MNLVRIVPPESDGGGLVKAQGTKVLLEDGSELGGVTRVDLSAEVNGVWRAVIHCYARPTVFPAVLADVVEGQRLAWWRRALCRLAGVVVDVRDLRTISKEAQRP